MKEKGGSWRRKGEDNGVEGDREKKNPESDSVSSSKKANWDLETFFGEIKQAINWEIISSRTS